LHGFAQSFPTPTRDFPTTFGSGCAGCASRGSQP
jgi:hypothetical protein